MSNEYNNFALLAFQHKSLRTQRSIVWILDNYLRINNNKISRIKRRYDNIKITNEHTSLDKKRRITIMQNVSAFLEVELRKLQSFVKI